MKQSTFNRKFNLKAFKAWIKHLPKNKTFQYIDITGCVFATFSKATFKKEMRCGGPYIRFHNDVCGTRFDFPKWARKIDDKIAGQGLITKKFLMKLIKQLDARKI